MFSKPFNELDDEFVDKKEMKVKVECEESSDDFDVPEELDNGALVVKNVKEYQSQDPNSSVSYLNEQLEEEKQ